MHLRRAKLNAEQLHELYNNSFHLRPIYVERCAGHSNNYAASNVIFSLAAHSRTTYICPFDRFDAVPITSATFRTIIMYNLVQPIIGQAHTNRSHCWIIFLKASN